MLARVTNLWIISLCPLLEEINGDPFFVLFTYRAIISTLKLILNVSSIYITFYFILHKVGEQHFFLYNSIETQEGEKKTELRMILDLFFFIGFIALGV